MKKISLDLDALVVDSFELEPEAGSLGTVNAYATTLQFTCLGPTCRRTINGCTCALSCDGTCDASCAGTCQTCAGLNTCDYSCGGSCDYTCGDTCQGITCFDSCTCPQH